MNKVSFLIAGAQKSGTTVLKAYLATHDNVLFSTQKENRYFLKEKHFIDNKPDYTIYHSMYPEDRSGKILGDKTPEYMYHEEVADRLYRYNKDFKIVILLRNPVYRAYSQYQRLIRHNLHKGKSFFELLINEPNQRRGKKMIARGLYVDQIKNLFSYFPKEQILIKIQDDLNTNTKSTLEEIQHFLDLPVLDLYSRITDKQNYRNDYSNMDSKSFAYLTSIFQPTLDPLEELININLDSWRSDMDNNI